MALSTNLVSYWKLDEASGNAADSVGSNTLTNTNTATYSAGKLSNAVNFVAGSTQKLSKTSATGLPSGSDARTISCWFKTSDINQGGGEGLVGYGTYASVQLFSFSQGTSGKIAIDIGAEARELNYTFSTDTWYHIVATLPGGGSKVFTTYVNGVSVGDITFTGTPNTVNSLICFGTNLGSDNYWSGSLDEVGIWSRALTADEVSQVFNSGRGNAYPLTDTPSLYGGVAYYKLENVNDEISGNVLNNNGSVTFPAGKIGNGADLERSSSQFLDIADNASLSLTGDLSFSMWIKLESHPANGEYFGLINKWQTAGQRSYEVFYYQDSGVAKLAFDSSSDGTNNTGFTINNTLSTATWYHIVFTKSSTTGTIYVNGTSIGNGTLASTIKDGTDNFRIGKLATADYFDGMIDEVFICNRALSSTEVTALYNSGAGRQYPFNIAYILACATGAFTYTGNTASLLFKRIMAMAQGTFTYTGVSVTLRKGFGMVLASGTYAYTGVAVGLRTARKIALASGSFTYSGVAVNFIKGYKLVIATGAYIYTGIAVRLRPSNIWSNIAKSVTSWTNSSKNTTTWSNLNKS